MMGDLCRIRYENGVTAPEVRTLLERKWLEPVEPPGVVVFGRDGFRLVRGSLRLGQHYAIVKANDE